ncbi:peroxiredoxin 1 isoform X2 [Aethina tumida]|uniref:peroxiredoxin 1 isoform X2 n=1 Tax=Aethina tumida TaxID=116153 RepID=UPI00096B5E40|nr:peroxiredoxin 1 isoform X2 [Aethina tumida]
MVLEIESAAPLFEANVVLGQNVFDVKSTDYSNKFVVMIFYPVDFTTQAAKELKNFSEKIEEFNKLNVQIFGISTDSTFTHLAWGRTPGVTGVENLKIPLIADKSHEVTRAFEMLNERDGRAFKGLYIIDNTDTIRHISIFDDCVDPNVDEIIQQIKLLQSKK